MMRSRLAIPVLLLGLLTAACGDDDLPDPPPEGTETMADTTATPAVIEESATPTPP